MPEDKRLDTSVSTGGSDAYNNALYDEKLKLRGIDHVIIDDGKYEKGDADDKDEFVDNGDDTGGNTDKKNPKHRQQGYQEEEGGSGWVIVIILMIIGCIGGYLYKRYKDG